jgi:hypothetical protein
MTFWMAEREMTGLNSSTAEILLLAGLVEMCSLILWAEAIQLLILTD